MRGVDPRDCCSFRPSGRGPLLLDGRESSGLRRAADAPPTVRVVSPFPPHRSRDATNCGGGLV